MKAAIFFERDGVLNLCETRDGEQQVPKRLEEFQINPAAAALLAELKQAGFVLIVTSNQPLVEQGELPRRELDLMHTVLRRKLPVDDVLFCPYEDDTHPCQKPQPGMFLESAFKWGLDLERSFVISDKWQDAKAAQVVGLTSIMINSPWIGDDHHDFIVEDLAAAVAKIHHLNQPLHEPVYARA